jgi:hypothetical protein
VREKPRVLRTVTTVPNPPRLHSYFGVDLDVLRDVTDLDVPRLAGQVRTIQSELTAGSAEGQ